MREGRALCEKIKAADAILIGAANGFSISEGYHLFADNEAFREMFGDFREKYGIRCLLQGMTHIYPSEEEKWIFWSRVISRYVHAYKKSPQMEYLQKIIGEKPYFIVTTNGEAHFQAAGFLQEDIYEAEGNLTQMQCERPCHNKLYPVRERVEEMAKALERGESIARRTPRCPVCGGPMHLHYAVHPGFFIPGQGVAKRYKDFLEQYGSRRLAILELGVGPQNPWIKEPFLRLATQGPQVTYIMVNKGEIYIPEEIRDRAYGLEGDLAEILEEMSVWMTD